MAHLSRRKFIQRAGVLALAMPFISRRSLAEPASRTVRHASFGAGGMAWADLSQIAKVANVEIVAICELDEQRQVEARQQFPQATFYMDWRQLLEREAGKIDSVNVSTPDHMHAPIGVTAMQLGKHVYGQKPLAHDLYEARRMTEIARSARVVTQMGIQVHSSTYNRMTIQIMKDGVIGKVKEVHSWCPKSWGDLTARPETTDPVPANFAWDLWLGVCAARPFIGGEYYHPGNWRKRLDFGTGTLGDMGCHIFDPVFEALGLREVRSVRSEGPAPNAWNWAINGLVKYEFAGTDRTAAATLPVTWYDGQAGPPAELRALLNGDPLPNTGSLLIGTEGVLVVPHMEAHATLYPQVNFKDYKLPVARGTNHWAEFINACRGEGKTTADFSYSGPLTEAILLGNVAAHFPQTTLHWHAAQQTFDLAAANHLVRREYRQGWQCAGLS